MSHPYYHALSSAKKHGGSWLDYIALHAWFDQTKAHIADSRHRLLLHNQWGIATAMMVFGQTYLQISDRNVSTTIETETLGDQHVEEDFGRIPSLPECFEKADVPSYLDRPCTKEREWVPGYYPMSVVEHATRTARKYGGIPEDYYRVHSFFDSPVLLLPDARHRIVTHNSFGIFLAEQVFGRVIMRTGGKPLPTRLVGELHVLHDTRRIASLASNAAGIDDQAFPEHEDDPEEEEGVIPVVEDLLSRLPLEHWMARGARQLSAELEGSGYGVD